MKFYSTGSIMRFQHALLVSIVLHLAGVTLAGFLPSSRVSLSREGEHLIFLEIATGPERKRKTPRFAPASPDFSPLSRKIETPLPERPPSHLSRAPSPALNLSDYTVSSPRSAQTSPIQKRDFSPGLSGTKAPSSSIPTPEARPALTGDFDLSRFFDYIHTRLQERARNKGWSAYIKITVYFDDAGRCNLLNVDPGRSDLGVLKTILREINRAVGSAPLFPDYAGLSAKFALNFTREQGPKP